MSTERPADAPEAMTAMIVGFVFAGLQELPGVLPMPITWTRCDPDGTIEFTLADGMPVRITVHAGP